MAVEYLDKYIERVADVPAELRRRFKLIRDLDERSAKLQTDLDEKCKEQLVSAQAKAAKNTPANKRPRSAADEPLNAEIAAGQARLVSWAEEKMQIAAQVYDMIDRHIRELDEDLKAFQSETEDEQQQSGLQDGETACQRLGIELGILNPVAAAAAEKEAAAAAAVAGTAADKDKPQQRQKRKYVRKKGVPAAAELAAPAPAPEPEEEPAIPVGGDPNEPRYCTCNNVSYGEMVACDNEDCPIEWFHYGCVGLTEQPKGKWYCQQCTEQMQQQKGQGPGVTPGHGHGHLKKK